MYWGHKASVLGFPRQGIPLDARAITDAATHDGETFYPHVEKLFETYPEIRPSIKRVLYDSACDSSEIKGKFENNLGIELKASPRFHEDKFQSEAKKGNHGDFTSMHRKNYAVWCSRVYSRIRDGVSGDEIRT